MSTKQATIYRLEELGINPDKVRISDGATMAVKKLSAAGHETYLVGGAVRDLLLGLAPKDFDVATSATPMQARRLFGRNGRIIGRRFRLLHVRTRNEIIEVATFRAPPQGTVRKVGRLAEDNTYGTAAQDAKRRDLTINSLMYDPQTGTVIDHEGGIKDIKRRTLRLIGAEELRYREDPVRILRVLRLAAKLDLKIASGTALPIRKCRDLLKQMPPPRVFDELLKILRSGASLRAFKLMRQHGILEIMLPQMHNFGKEQLQFTETFFTLTDRRIRDGKHISVSFAFLALFWPAVSARWYELCSDSNSHTSDFEELYEQCGVAENWLITRRSEFNMRLLWNLQTRFEKYIDKPRAVRLHRVHWRALKKTIAFLRLRDACGESCNEQASWWEEFLANSKETDSTD